MAGTKPSGDSYHHLGKENEVSGGVFVEFLAILYEEGTYPMFP